MLKPAILLMALVLTETAPAQNSAIATPRKPANCSNGILEMSLTAIKKLGLPRRPIDQIPIPVWEGLIRIRIKNITSLTVHVIERADQYDIVATDASGKHVPMTEFGEDRLPAIHAGGPSPPIGRVSAVDLAPTAEVQTELSVASFYKIEPGKEYTITVGRTGGLPRVDQLGNPINHPGLSCTLTIPAGPLVEQH